MTTQPTDDDVGSFIDAIPNEQRRADCRVLADLFTRITGHPARMWGSGLVGFGTYHYVYDSGREGDSMIVGFAPRKTATTLYFFGDITRHTCVLATLGPHTTGKACLYLKRVAPTDVSGIEELARLSVIEVAELFPAAL